MSEPVYVIYKYRAKEAWYALSLEEQEQWIQKFEALMAQYAIKDIVSCSIGWSLSGWESFRVLEVKDMETGKKFFDHTSDDDLQGSRYWDIEGMYGTKMPNT